MYQVSRRNLLQRSALFLATAVGALIPGSLSAAAAFPGTALAGESTERTLQLRGSDVQLLVPGRTRGQLPRAGEQMRLEGNLAEGSFVATCVCTGMAGAAGGWLPGRPMAFHQFDLPDGIIHGMGLMEPGPVFSGTFAIVGGTGRYAGAQGHYTAAISPEGWGSGEAAFDFHLTSGLTQPGRE